MMASDSAQSRDTDTTRVEGEPEHAVSAATAGGRVQMPCSKRPPCSRSSVATFLGMPDWIAEVMASTYLRADAQRPHGRGGGGERRERGEGVAEAIGGDEDGVGEE